MDQPQVAPAPPHHARIAIRFGRRARMSAEVSITSGGLMSIGALVSSILLSSAVIVRAARHRPHPRHVDGDPRIGG